MGRRPYVGEEKDRSIARKQIRLREYDKRFRNTNRGILLYKRLEYRRITKKATRRLVWMALKKELQVA